MHRRRRTNHAPQLSSLFHTELGHDLPERLSWRGELAALSRLEPSAPGLHPTTFTFSQDRTWEKRHSYIAKLSPSPDGALLAAASTDALLELHEPGDSSGDSLRLTLKPTSPLGNLLRLSGVAWAAPGGAESIVMGFENLAQVWVFDLQTCNVDRPTSKFRLGSQMDSASVGACDVARVDNDCFAVSLHSGLVQVYDVRVSNRKKDGVGRLRTGVRDAVVDAQGMYIYSTGGGGIIMHDRRMARSVKTGPSSSVKSFGGKGSSLKDHEPLSRTVIGDREDSRVSYLKALPGAAPGCVMYQTSSGSVGYADMAASGASVEHIPEQSQRTAQQRPNETGLDDFGTAGHMMHRAWFVKRRQCDVKVGQHGRGWRVIAPLVHEKGVRVLSFGPGVKTRSVNVWKRHDYTCAYAASPAFDKFVLGTSACTVESIEANFDRQEQDEKGTATAST